MPTRAADAVSSDPKAAVVAASLMWLKQIDEGRYQAAYDSSGAWFHGLVSGPEWITWEEKYAARDGRLVARTPSKEVRIERVPDGKFAGEWADIEYAAFFEKNPSMTQLVVLKKEADGAWQVAGDSLGDRKP